MKASQRFIFLQEKCENHGKSLSRHRLRTNNEPIVNQNLNLPLKVNLFIGDYWTLQQDSAPAHMAKRTQWWLKENLPDFIQNKDWSSRSPDLNPHNYKLWSVLEVKVCQ